MFVRQRNRHRAQQDLICCYPSVRTVTGAHQSLSCYMPVNHTSRTTTHTHGQSTQYLNITFDTNSKNWPTATATRERYCVLTESPQSRARTTGTWLARNVLTSRGRKLRSVRTVGKNGAFCDHSCDSCLKKERLISNQAVSYPILQWYNVINTIPVYILNTSID